MDKTDMQLLASAAKAAGIDVWFPRMNGGKSDNGTRVILTPCHTRNAVGDVVEWNPLTDDGDALRLLETLDLAVWSRGFSGGLRRVKAKDGHNYLEEDLRRAIVLAAAGRPADTKKATAKEALQAVLALDEKGAILSTSGYSAKFHAAMQLVHEALS